MAVTGKLGGIYAGYVQSPLKQPQKGNQTLLFQGRDHFKPSYKTTSSTGLRYTVSQREEKDMSAIYPPNPDNSYDAHRMCLKQGV